MLENDISPIPYVRALGIGPEAISDEDFNHASSSLGGFSNGPTPTEVAGAYAAIGNQGVFNDPYVIERIVDANREVVYKKT